MTTLRAAIPSIIVCVVVTTLLVVFDISGAWFWAIWLPTIVVMVVLHRIRMLTP